MAYISGNILHIDSGSIIIVWSSGIGYELLINERIYGHFSDKTQGTLFVYHAISENAQSLFWFLDISERNMFKELIKISGVGGRVAQMILSLGVTRLKQAIVNEDKKTLESVKWVGKKMAEKIILELKDKDFLEGILIWEKEVFVSKEVPPLHEQILSTLTLMGYNAQKVQEVLHTIPSEMSDISQMIPYVIRNISK